MTEAAAFLAVAVAAVDEEWIVAHGDDPEVVDTVGAMLGRLAAASEERGCAPTATAANPP